VMQAEATDLLIGREVVRGVRYSSPSGTEEIRATLTVGADGRTSRTRAAAGLPIEAASPPMDVIWFRLSRRANEAESFDLHLVPGHIAAVINRRDYWQIAWVIPKDGMQRVREAGLGAFRASVAQTLPELADRVDELRTWDDLKLLTVRADRLRRWYRPGYLAIGDAAHAMSPVGGVGINVAIQDAVEAANLLWRPLCEHRLSPRDLKRVQVRRELPVRITQGLQALIQDRLVTPTLGDSATLRLPRIAQVALRTPLLRDLPPRLIGLGVHRVHVRTPARAGRGAPWNAERGQSQEHAHAER
jgi:2-polyprenyl-6-methoxyphenol hydroxylase-like FAD-dependent oxidoreductase